ncbi:sulfatase-like hydrolase/transferase [Pseudorhodobacter sp. W20_MBD10_FR17]|uniref:sulfatase-like hydrolase/transferase n=1 Tax=Pseudorhodobacter sp. W20_MBD10_FR17 TaxID=3240266 RepID=UPI003F9C695A
MEKRAFLAPLAIGLIPMSAFAEPNILLIIADDMGVEASHCYSLGENQAKMPNIEQLCANGLVFDNAYSAPVCSPTRASIMTGKYGFRTGVGAAIPKDGGDNGLSDNETSLFDVLASTPYKSNLIGKWHLSSSFDDLTHPDRLGVSDYFGMLGGGVPDYFNWQAVENGKTVQIKNYATTELTDRSISWIAEQQSPWFLWLAYNAPHAPFHVPPSNLHSAKDLNPDKAAIDANPLPYYNAMLEAMDTEIGRLLGTLSEDVRKDTVVIFIGDNGTPGQVSRAFYGPRRSKGTIYEGGTHIPFIVQGPSFDKGRNPSLVNTTDLFATIADLAGVKSEAQDSISILPIVNGKSGPRDDAYVEHFSDLPSAPADVFGWAIREGDWKLVVEDGAEPKLYNIAVDPLEAVDLLADGASDAEAAIVTRLEARVEDLKAESR